MQVLAHPVASYIGKETTVRMIHFSAPCCPKSPLTSCCPTLWTWSQWVSSNAIASTSAKNFLVFAKFQTLRLDHSAGRLIDESRSGAEASMKPADLNSKQITRLHQLLHEAKFRDPSGDHLSPAGETGLPWNNFLHPTHFWSPGYPIRAGQTQCLSEGNICSPQKRLQQFFGLTYIP